MTSWAKKMAERVVLYGSFAFDSESHYFLTRFTSVWSNLHAARLIGAISARKLSEGSETKEKNDESWLCSLFANNF